MLEMIRNEFENNDNITYMGVNPNFNGDDDTPLSDDEEYFIITCTNGYGASIIRHPGSYGYDRGLYELAVISGITMEMKEGVPTKISFVLDYETPITDDVIGYLTPENVINTIREIIKLPNYEDEKGDE